MKYLITEEIESPSKVTKHIEAFDFFFIIIYVGVSFALMGGVYSALKPFYMIFSLAVAVFLTSKSAFNKKRRNYESLILLLKKDYEIYRPLYGEGNENEKG